MAKPSQVKADPDALAKLVAQASSLAGVISASFKAIDQTLEGLEPHWVGSQYDVFHSSYRLAQMSQSEALKQLEGFCSGAFPAVPKEYGQLEGTIRSEVQKLKNGQS